MSERGFLFLFSVVMIAGGVGAAAWLVASGQAGSVDGLFLVLTALLTALVFALYLKFLFNRARAEVSKPATQTAKAGVAAPAAKSAPTAVSSSSPAQ